MNYLPLSNYTSSVRKQPIDPICAMCRIISLNFKGVNTRISVNDHSINIQDPAGVQKWLRFYYGESRESIFELFNLVTHLIAWFLVPVKREITTTEDDDLVPEQIIINPPVKKANEKFVADLKKMIPFMCRGLERLQDTYKTGSIVLTLQYYINLLQDGMNGKFDINTSLPKCLLEDLWLDMNLKNKVVSMWDYNKIHVMCELYENCFRVYSENPPDRDEIIDGYLSSIDKILTIYEKNFKQQLRQWGLNF